MRVRDKIAIALFSLTLLLGAIIFWQSDSEDSELRRFRWFAAKAPMRLMSDEIFTAENSASLWFGGLSLAGMILLGLIAKAINGAEIRAFRDRLIEMEVAKAELESLLQDAVWKEKHARDAKELADKDSESNLKRIYDLENQLRDTEQLLRTREQEPKNSRYPDGAGVSGSRSTGAAAAAREKALQQEVKKNAEQLQAKETALRQMESSMRGKIRSMERELAEHVDLLRERERELESLKDQLSEQNDSRGHTESLLREEVKKGKEASRVKEAALDELGKRLKTELSVLQNQLSQERSQRQQASTEMVGLKTEMSALQAKLVDAETAKERAENQRESETQRHAKALQAKETALKRLEERSAAVVRTIEERFADNDKKLKERDAELIALRSKILALAAKGSAKDQSQSLLQQELKSHAESARAKDVALKEIEKRLGGKVQSLETMLAEKERELLNRNGELESAKGELGSLAKKFADVQAARERAERLLEHGLKKSTELLRSKDSALQEAEKNLLAKERSFEQELERRDALLQEREVQMQELRAQVSTVGSGSEESQRALASDLGKSKQALEAKNEEFKSLEQRWKGAVRTLEEQLGGQETLLEQRTAEAAGLRSQLDAANARLAEVASAAEPAAGQVASPSRELEESMKRIRTLERSLKETGEIINVRDKKIERLEEELKEKRTALARHEIEVWQNVERRGQWKRRLSKLGISTKN